VQKNLVSILGLLLLVTGLNGYAATPQTTSNAAVATYTKAVAAFRHGDYATALKTFLQARAEGYRGSQLTYSLGVTYYRLGRFTDAKREFESLLSEPELAALCHYNLGLVAEGQKDETTALREYRLAYSQARQLKLKSLADSQIRRLTAGHSRPLSWFGYANLTTGYDDNVALAPQKGAVLQSAGTGSPLMTILVGGGHQLTGTYNNGILLFANFYNTDYFRLSRFNESMISFGGRSRHTAGKWAWQIGLSGSHITVGGTGFETLGSLRLKAERSLSASNTLAGGFYYDRISGQSTYSYLSGSQERLFVEDRIHTAFDRLTFGFQHELNSRNNYTTANQFLSTSPTRNRLYADIQLFPRRELSWFAGLEYEKSHYTPADVLPSGTGTGTTTVTRDDTLSVVRLGARYKLSPHWSLKGQYRYLNNQSNINGYAYKSNTYTLSLNYLFY